MQVENNASRFQAFELPLWGRMAAVEPPSWLVNRMLSYELRMNSMGGLNKVIGSEVISSCIAGDFVLLGEDDAITFVGADDFERDFTPLIKMLDN